MGQYFISLLFGSFFLFTHQGCTGSESCPCTEQQDSCTCQLTEADTTLTVEVKEKYVKFPLESDHITLHFITKNNTGNFYNKPESNEVVVERFEKGKWERVLAKKNDVLTLREGPGRFTGLFPWEEKTDSFFLQPNRFVYETGLYRARFMFVRSRAITEEANLFTYLRNTEERIVRYAEFEIVENLPEDTLKRKNMLLCNCTKRQMAINECRFKDSTMIIRVDRNDLKKSSIEKLEPNFLMINNTPSIYLFRPHYDFHIERREGNKWQSLPRKRKKEFTKKYEFFEKSLSGYPVGTFFYPGEKNYFPMAFELFDHSFQKGKYRVVVTVKK